MPDYHYKAMNAAGDWIKGVVLADSPDDAREQVRQQGFLQVKLRTSNLPEGTSSSQCVFCSESPRNNGTHQFILPMSYAEQRQAIKWVKTTTWTKRSVLPICDHCSNQFLHVTRMATRVLVATLLVDLMFILNVM